MLLFFLFCFVYLFNLNLVLSGISCLMPVCDFSPCFLLPFISFFLFFCSRVEEKNWRVYVDWHAHCSHVGVNVVCIDAVYKCCIKKPLIA